MTHEPCNGITGQPCIDPVAARGDLICGATGVRITWDGGDGYIHAIESTCAECGDPIPDDFLCQRCLDRAEWDAAVEQPIIPRP